MMNLSIQEGIEKLYLASRLAPLTAPDHEALAEIRNKLIEIIQQIEQKQSSQTNNV